MFDNNTSKNPKIVFLLLTLIVFSTSLIILPVTSSGSTESEVSLDFELKSDKEDNTEIKIIASAQTEVNVLSGVIHFEPSDLSEAFSLDTSKSVIDLWTSEQEGEPGPKLTQDHKIYFEGAVTGKPHINTGELFRMIIEAPREEIDLKLNFTEATVYKSDGRGTEATVSLGDLKIERKEALASPENLRESEIEPTSVLVEWDPVPNAETYMIELLQDDLETVIKTVTILAPENMTRLTGLNSDTNYHWRIKSQAEGYIASKYNTETFTTIPEETEEEEKEDEEDEPETDPDFDTEPDPSRTPEDETDQEMDEAIDDTDEELPSFESGSVTEKDDDEFQFTGHLRDLGQSEEVEVFFRYRIKGEETWQETAVIILTEPGEFSRSVSGLAPGEEYEVKAIVRFGDREITEEITTFSSTEKLPPVDERPTTPAENLRETFSRAQQTTKEFVNSPVGQVSGTVSASAGMAAGAGQILTFFPGITSLADLYLLLLRLIGSLLGWLGLRRQGKPWGTVYDSVTKRPLDPVYVTAHKDSPEGEEVGSAITDIDGRFGFFLPAGVYYLKAGKTHYRFPSTELAGRSSDELYSDLYFGEKIETSGEEVLNYNIPMDPVGFDWNEFAKNKQSLFKMHSDRETLKNRIFNTVFYLGFAFTGLLMIFSPSWLNGLILTVYVLILLWQWYFGVTQRPVQVIGPDGQPLPFAILRFHLADLDMEVKHVVSDALGRFYVLIRPGRYYVTVEEKLSDGSYRQIFRSGNWSLEKGVLEGDIKISEKSNKQSREQ